MDLKKLSAVLIAVLFMLLPMGPAGDVFAVNNVTYCDIRGYEDFYYFPVKACDGETYYLYVYDFGDGCDISMDTSAGTMYFQYSSVLAVNMPAKEYTGISSKKMNAYLEKYDFRKMEPGVWTDGGEDYANKSIAVMENLSLGKKFEGDREKLSPAAYNETKIELDIEIIPYQLYTDIRAEFFSYNGKTVVKLSGTDFYPLAELVGKDIPKPEEVSKAYYETSKFEGYFYCSSKPLEEYFGKLGGEPSKTAPIYYRDPSGITLPFPKEDLTGKKLSDFLDPGDFAPDDSEYYVLGKAAVCPPEGVTERSVYSSETLYFSTDNGCEFRLWKITEEESVFPEDAELTVKKTGKIFGKPCKYYEWFPSEKRYCANLFFQIDGEYFQAQAAVYGSGWNDNFRELFGQFFGSIKRSEKLQPINFGKAPEKYFKSVKIKNSEYVAAECGLKLYVPKSLDDTENRDWYFYASKDGDMSAMAIQISCEEEYGGYMPGYLQNYHRPVFYENYAGGSAELYNFRRNGANCTLAVRKEVDFIRGWHTVYDYNIDCGDKFYTVYVILPEKSDYTEEDVVKVLSSVKII